MYFVVIHFVITRSLKTFTHATSLQLPWPVQAFCGGHCSERIHWILMLGEKVASEMPACWLTKNIVFGVLGLGLCLVYSCVNTLRPRQNGRHFADDNFKHIFFNENVRISIKNSLKFVPKCPINNIPALVQIMAWRRPGDKSLSEPMIVR